MRRQLPRKAAQWRGVRVRLSWPDHSENAADNATPRLREVSGGSEGDLGVGKPVRHYNVARRNILWTQPAAHGDFLNVFVNRDRLGALDTQHTRRGHFHHSNAKLGAKCSSTRALATLNGLGIVASSEAGIHAGAGSIG